MKVGLCLFVSLIFKCTSQSSPNFNWTQEAYR